MFRSSIWCLRSKVCWTFVTLRSLRSQPHRADCTTRCARTYARSWRMRTGTKISNRPRTSLRLARAA
eukprot:3962624-Alexandrium_andersonii.AAC.1